MRDKNRVMIDINMDRVREMLRARVDGDGADTPQGLSLRAGLNRDAVRDILRGKSQQASLPTLQALAKAMGGDISIFAAAPSREEAKTSALPVPNLAVEPPNPEFTGYTSAFPRNVPIFGTAHGADFNLEQDGVSIVIEQTEMTPGEIVGYARRPPRIADNRSIYAMQVAGSSMEPKFEIGEIIYVDPKRLPSIGDYVVVQLRDDNDDVICAMVKRLARRNATTIELEQFNPQQRFSIKMSQVAEVHRVVPWSEMLG